MKKNKLTISVMSGLLAVLLLFGFVAGMLPTSAEAAQSSSAIQQQIDKLKDQKAEIDANIKELEGQLSENLSEMEAIVAQKNLIDQEVFALHQQVQNINDQVAAYSQLINEKQVELDDAEARLADLKQKNKERIRAMEEGGKLTYWSVLFKSNDFSDFLDRLTMIQEIAAADDRRLKEISKVAKEIEEAKQELEAEKTALEATKAELAESEKVLEEKRAEAEKLLADLIATGEEYERMMEEAEKEASKLESEISDKKEDYENAKRQEWLSTSVPPTYKPNSSGTAGAPNTVEGVTWLIPCNYTRFSSPFGYRIHPIYGDRRFHYGVDLAAPSGTPIIATRSGKVTWTTYDSSSGYYVVIDHGDGFESKYLHMTHYIVSPGQQVTAGQVIGYVGSTGASTGPHLHFSIKYNGEHVNPANYINI